MLGTWIFFLKLIEKGEVNSFFRLKFKQLITLFGSNVTWIAIDQRDVIHKC